MTSCTDEEIERVLEQIAKGLREGRYRVTLRLRGVRFSDCLELMRRVTAQFIQAGITVVEED